MGQTMILWEKGHEGGITRPMNKVKAFDNLRDAYDILIKHGVKCCLFCGTLLGIYRDNDFISYDDDVDIWADTTTLQNRIKIEDELRQVGFYVPPMGDKDKPVDPKTNAPFSDTVAIRNGEKVEIWWFAKIGNQYVYDIYRQPPCIKHDEKYYHDFPQVIFKGKLFNVPHYTEEYVALLYGFDWRIPQKGKKYANS